jgi:hypothetical protein
MDTLTTALNRTKRIRQSHRSPMFGFAFFALLSFLFASGCEDSQLGTVDPSGLPPFIRLALVRPDSLSLRTITPVGGNYTISSTVQLTCTDPQGSQDIVSVGADVYYPYSTDIVAQASLADDGKAPDSTAGDRVYTGTIKFSITQTQAGPFRIRFHVKDALGLESNAIDRRLLVSRDNRPPVLSNLVAPDSIKIPSPRDTLVLMTVKATDPDGQEDIREVYFRSLDSSDPNFRYLLLDNGNLNNGDAVEGDGIYSIVIILRDSATRKTYRFAFQATDAFGDTSATILHNLTVR